MTFSLIKLMPKVFDVKLVIEGKEVLVPMLPLTYTQYHNVELDVERPDPEDYKVRKLVDNKMQDIVDKTNPEYIAAINQYAYELRQRRLALALAGGGAEELQDKTLQEQVEVVSQMDGGVANALMNLIEREAKHRVATRFQQVPE